MTEENKSVCPFCQVNSQAEVILDSPLVYAIYDKFPVSNGHALVILKRHCADYFKLNPEERSACWEMINRVKEIIQERFNPDGFNIGINVNEFAGQTIFHVHIHLIPRYRGDIDDPRGGVRGVIPEKRGYGV
ncbi:MAG: HIT family protein [Bacteroidales bacterium]|nr:HIT family protein [Bacteroidales bacterium]